MTGENVGLVQTVLGAIQPDDLGVTLTHEHLLIDLAFHREPPSEASLREIYYRPVTLETVGYLKHYGYANRDDGQLLDIQTAIEEIGLYKQHGGGSVVDATSIGIARDPVGLSRIARATGLNIIMGSSYYVGSSHPEDMSERTEDEIFEKIVEDVTVGVDGTGIRSGIIGEVGCNFPLSDNERKVVRASGRAQKATGAPLLIHPGRGETSPLEIIGILQGVGADLSKTIMGHIDRTVFMRDNLKAIADTGCYLEWDLFGREQSLYVHNLSIDMPNDAKRMDDIAWVIEQGHGDRVVVAQDVCGKSQLIKYGGYGYAYILESIRSQNAPPRLHGRVHSTHTGRQPRQGPAFRRAGRVAATNMGDILPLLRDGVRVP